MRRVIPIAAEALLPLRSSVLQRMGMDESDIVSPRLDDLLARGGTIFARMAAPVILIEPVTQDEFEAVYDGTEANAPVSPLDEIFPRADRLALFTATLGAAIDHAIRGEFQRGDPALAYVLDVMASDAADRLAYVAADRFRSSVAVRSTAAALRVLPYSPGYCGWHVSGQRALFERLRPGEIGVALTAGCMMDPQKSVSGVLVAGPSAVHRFRPTFPFCDACETHACRARMAAVK